MADQKVFREAIRNIDNVEDMLAVCKKNFVMMNEAQAQGWVDAVKSGETIDDAEFGNWPARNGHPAICKGMYCSVYMGTPIIPDCSGCTMKAGAGDNWFCTTK